MADKKETNEVKTISQLNSTFLTEEYVYQTKKGFGQNYTRTIFLKDISRIDYGYRSHPLLLIVAIILFLWGIIGLIAGRSYNREEFISMIVAAVVSAIVYFFTRRSVVAVTAHSRQSIVQPISRNAKAAKNFMEEILKAKRKF